MENRTTFFEKNPAKTLITIIVIFLILIDFIFGKIFIPNSYRSFRTPHYFYHHGLLANQESYAAWGPRVYPFTTNSLGFRDFTTRKISPISKEENQKRILIMGDSHTEAVGINIENSFAGITQKYFENNNSTIEILNAGAISYSPKIHYLKAKYLLEKNKLKIDEIFVFIDISDVQNELVYEKFKPANIELWRIAVQKLKTYLNKNSIIYFSIHQIKERKNTAEFFENAVIFDEHRKQQTPTNAEKLYSSFFSHFDDNILLSNPMFHGVGAWMYDDNFKILAEKGISLGQENILKLKELCDNYGIKLTISIHPWREQVIYKDLDNLYVNSWKQFACENNIGFINLFPVFITQENPYITMKKYYIRGDQHWNENGHKKVASKLINVIEQNLITN